VLYLLAVRSCSVRAHSAERESSPHVPQGALTLLGLGFAIAWAKLATELVGRLGQLPGELKGPTP